MATVTRSTIFRRTVALTFAGALVVACTGDDDTADSTTTTTTVLVPPTAASSVPSTVPPELGDEYAAALADPTIDATGLVVTGSDAARYLELRRTSSALLGIALTTSGDVFVAGGTVPTTIAGRGESTICDAGGCTVLGDFVTDAGGTLVDTLSIDGRPLAGRIAGAGTTADAEGIVMRVRVAYVTNADQIVVVLSTSNTSEYEVELFGFAAIYQPTAGGGGAEAAGAWGAGILPSGASGVTMLVFETTDLGGRIGIRGLRRDGLDVTLDIPVPSAQA